MTMKTEVEDCLKYFNIMYFATHKKKLPMFFEKEKDFVSGGKFTVKSGVMPVLNQSSAVAKINADQAIKALEKAETKLAAAQIAKPKATILNKAAFEKATMVWGKKATVAVKETAKVTAEATTKSAAKKIPVVSLGAGIFFGSIRVASGVCNFVQGNTTRGLEELGKAALEVASGAAGCFPGAGTAVSIGIDASLLCWDIGDASCDDNSAEGNAKADAPERILLKIKVSKISKAIINTRYSIAAFLNDVFKITFAKLKCHTDEMEAAKDAYYIYEMVKNVFDNTYFTGNFPTETIVQKMAEIGFSECQVDSFQVLADEYDRK